MISLRRPPPRRVSLTCTSIALRDLADKIFEWDARTPFSGRKNFVISDNFTNQANSLKLKSFQKFDSAASALEEAASIMEGKVTPRLASMLDGIKEEKKVSLAVADAKLGNSIHCKLLSDNGLTLDVNRQCHQQAPRP